MCSFLRSNIEGLLKTTSAADKDYAAPVGRKYRMFVLLAIAGLCVVREAFFVATVNDTKQVSRFLMSARTRSAKSFLKTVGKQRPPVVSTLRPP